jgi:cytochrome c peroxidase
MKSVLFFAVLLLFLAACHKDTTPVLEEIPPGELVPNLPEQPYSYDDFTPPPHLTGLVYDFFNSTPTNNPVTNEGATLGRVLFYDKKLSENNTVSCASCHFQQHAFSDPDQFSEGLYGEFTTRNSMAIINAFMGFRFFWDLRANGLEEQALMPIQHPVEMNMELTELVNKLTEIDYYPELFEAAFGTAVITEDQIALALSQFMRSIYSVNSKFDIGIQSNFVNYTAQELRGRDLFFNDDRTNCNNCHQTYYFFDTGGHNNGSDSIYIDEGLFTITGNPNHVGFFNTPTLRNIEYTAPYFHDGRFATLEDVVEFYNSGMNAHVNLDERLTTDGLIGGPPRQMNLTTIEKAALVAFLKTLSEPSILTEERWSDPFE